MVPKEKTLERAHQVAFGFGAMIEANAFAANKLLTRRPTIEFLAGEQWQNERKIIMNMAKM